MTPQEALFQGSGAFSAVSVFRFEAPSAERRLPALGGELLAELRRLGVSALVAIRPGVGGLGAAPSSRLLPHEGPGGRIPSTQGDLLVQLAADERAPLMLGLRALGARFAGLLTCDEELQGGKLADGREPFGFRDGLAALTEEQLRALAVVPEGPLAGTSHLLYVRFHQRVERFQRLAEREQARVMGRDREGNEFRDAPADAHVPRLRGAAMARRGFPFRAHGQEGLAFLAAAASPEVFEWSLARFSGREGPPDALFRYCEAVGAGHYLAPPREWFS